MPELPEVETVVRDLRPLLIGRSIQAIHVGSQALRRPWEPEWAEQIVGAAIDGIRRRGKWIIIDLSTQQPLVVHLGMTGQLTVVASTSPKEDHTHLVFDLSGSLEQLRFRDIRRFGSVTLFENPASLDTFLADTLGPEPFDLSDAMFTQSIRDSSRCIKAILLDQHVVAGVGNIYADEALHRAKLHPATKGTALGTRECHRLRRAIAEVLTTAIERRGSTIRNYVGGSGLKGGYQERFRVYGRTGQPCGECQTEILCTRLAGRSSHYCPTCQPFPA